MADGSDSGNQGPKNDDLKEEVLFAVLQYFGEECRLPFDASGRRALRELLGRTLWDAIDRNRFHWNDTRVRKYVRKQVKRIADEVCDKLDDSHDKIDEQCLRRIAHPFLMEEKKKADEKLERLRRLKERTPEQQEEHDLLDRLTKYCENYSE
jgi:hypothetical protein